MPAPTTTSLGRALGTRPAGTALTPALTGTLRLMLISDSLGVGTGNDGLSWRQPVAEMLTAIGVSYTAVGSLSSPAPDWGNHYAASGQSIADVIADFTATPTLLSTPDPDVVFLTPIGRADINAGATGAEALLELVDLLEILRAYTNGRGVSPRVICSYITLDTVNTAADTATADFNAGLAAVVATQIGLGQQIVISDPRPSINCPRGAFCSDGAHWSDDGYRLAARHIFAATCNAIGIAAQWGRPTS